MNVAILTAGGRGSRMHQHVPKQFMMIEGKPLIVYTMEKFQNNRNIDFIVLVCLNEWQERLKQLIQEYKITKAKYITNGGATGQESIFNGLKIVNDNFDEETVVLIHDGNRPMVTDQLIDTAILKCKEKGNAVAYIPCQEVVFYSDDKISSKKQIDRSKVMRTQTPHAYKLDLLNNVFKSANDKGLTDCVATCSICASLGIETYFYEGSEKNIKITTPEDVDIFKALMKEEKTCNE